MLQISFSGLFFRGSATPLLTAREAYAVTLLAKYAKPAKQAEPSSQQSQRLLAKAYGPAFITQTEPLIQSKENQDCS